jgi:hypothetical protein
MYDGVGCTLALALPVTLTCRAITRPCTTVAAAGELEDEAHEGRLEHRPAPLMLAAPKPKTCQEKSLRACLKAPRARESA